MRRCAMLAGALVLLTFGGCREGVPPFSPAGPDTINAPSYQLTFGVGQDRDPRWSPDGTTIIYHTDVFGALPRARGIVLEIPRARGTADPPLFDVQLGENLLATPAYSPTADRIAYMHLIRLSPIQQCIAEDPPPPLEACNTPQPVLDSAVLRVRRVGDITPFFNDPALPVHFDGPDANERLGEEGPFVQRLHPFQLLHREENAMVFRPSWAPDGQRIVFSDGLRLLVWRLSETTATAIPGTEDGVSPAWSPDGNWIAFTLLERGDSSVNACFCTDGQHLRWRFPITGRKLVLIRPDGTSRTVLGDGEEPSWSANSQELFLRRGFDIVRVPVAGGVGTPIPNTLGGRTPAPSPDGKWLAFARQKSTGSRDFDIWVVSLTP